MNRIEILNFPSLVSPKKEAEAKYWNGFKFPIQTKLLAPITHLSFSPVAPHDFIVSCSSRLEIYSGNTSSGEPEKSISKFKEYAYGGAFRDDGKLIVSGGGEGVVRVFTRWGQQLRTMKAHKGEVWLTLFSPNLTDIMSGGDDGLLKRYDLGVGVEVQEFGGHKDKVRNGLINKENRNVWVSGCFDGKVRGWDLRSPKSIFQVDNESEVTSLVAFPHNQNLLAVGGNDAKIKIFDLLKLSSASSFPSHHSTRASSALLDTLNNHQKAVTSLGFDGFGKRLISASVDQLAKVYDISDNFLVKHSFKYPSPILCFSLSPDHSHMVCGMSDGLLSMKHRIVAPKTPSSIHRPSPSSDRYFSKQSIQHTGTGDEEEHSIEEHSNAFFASKNPYEEEPEKVSATLPYTTLKQKRRKTYQFEKHLKRFNYRMATDSALQTRNSKVIISFFNEVINRNEVINCISGFDEKTIQPLLSFLIENITNPNYTAVCTVVADGVLTLYGKLVGSSRVFDELLLQLLNKIKQEQETQKNLKRLQGVLETLRN